MWSYQNSNKCLGCCGCQHFSQSLSANNKSIRITRPILCVQTMEIGRSQQLGRGRLAVVFQGVWKTKQIPVAVKRILLEDVETDQQLENHLKSLNHNNVLKFFHAENDSSFRYYALELCVSSLDKLFLKDGHPLKYDGPMLPTEDVLIQLASGLQYIHSLELIHGEIKPTNTLIWVDNQQVLMKWSDFGLNKQVNQRGTNQIKPTSEWLAPELLETNQNDEENQRNRQGFQSDVFAQGLVFGYFLLDGQHLYGSVDIEIPMNIIRNNPINLAKIQPENVRQLISKMLQDDPFKRITSKDTVQHLDDIRNQKNQSQSSKLLEIQKYPLETNGFGYVFEGFFGKNRQKVAVKRVQIFNKSIDEEQETLLRNIRHPNIIRFYHTESDLNFRYYAIEMCVASLDKLFVKVDDPKKYNGPMPPRDEVLLQLASGLEYVHKMGVIHCDMKPSNVLIWLGSTDSTQVRSSTNVLMKWSNFGLCTRQSHQVNSLAIKPVHRAANSQWLAPETLELLQHQQDDDTNNQTGQIHLESNVFSLGLVFGYFLLDGQHIYGPIKKVKSNIKKDRPINLSEIQDHLVRELIGKMLAKKPENRMTSSGVIQQLNAIKKLLFKEKETLLLALCEEKNPDLKKIENLLNQGVDINCVNQHGSTPLHTLLEMQLNYKPKTLLDMVQFFLEKGANVNWKNSYGENPLLKLIVNYTNDDLIEIIQLFIQHGVDINSKNKYDENLLQYLSQYYHNSNLIDIFRLLIQHGIDVSSCNEYGFNALPVLCRNYTGDNLIDIVRLFVQYRNDENDKTHNEKQALILLFKYYKRDNLMDIIRLLSQIGSHQTDVENDSITRKLGQKRKHE